MTQIEGFSSTGKVNLTQEEQELESFLIGHGLKQYFNRLIDESLTLEILKNLDLDEFNELCNNTLKLKFGDKIKLKKAINLLKKKNKKSNTPNYLCICLITHTHTHL